MEKYEIKAYNELIGRFMGGKFCLIASHTPNVTFKEHPKHGRYSNSLSFHPKLLMYHKSWDWMMPVVHKIETLGYRFTMSTTFVRVHTCKVKWDDCDEYNCAVFDGKLNTVYYAIVEFIKWYNKL